MRMTSKAAAAEEPEKGREWGRSERRRRVEGRPEGQ